MTGEDDRRPAGGRADLLVQAPSDGDEAARGRLRWRHAASRSARRTPTSSTATTPRTTSTCCRTASPRRCRSTRPTRTGTSRTASAGGSAFLDGKPGLLVDDQRPPLPGRADVRGRGGRPRRDDDREPQRPGPPDAPARSPRGGAVTRRRAGHREPVVDRLARRRRTARPTTSRSSPTTPASGWTTATTCRTPARGSSRT